MPDRDSASGAGDSDGVGDRGGGGLAVRVFWDAFLKELELRIVLDFNDDVRVVHAAVLELDSADYGDEETSEGNRGKRSLAE